MRTFVLSVVSLALVACAGAPQDPAPAPAPIDSTLSPKSACIQRIFCKDGSEYCCLTNGCEVASCEPPRWDRATCTCQ